MSSHSRLGRVLVVDDDPTMLELISSILELLQVDTVLTEDSSEALAMIIDSRFDLVVSDLSMPGLDGHDLIESTRSAGLQTRFLFVSGSGRIPDVVKLMKEGAVGFLEKPFDPKEFKHQVLSALRQSSSSASQVAPSAQDEPSADATFNLEISVVEKTSSKRGGKEQLGRYEVRRLLSQGGMGRIQEGYDPKLKRVVALKTLRPPSEPNLVEEFVDRFHREATVLANLSHPNIVPIYDFGQTKDGTLYLVMELVNGVSLAAMLGRGEPLETTLALQIAVQVARALRFVHELGVTHRDVKPGNVMVCPDNTIKLLDFGIARTEDSDLTHPQYLLGSPSYLSPEAARGESVDGRADQFSLGTLIIHMLSGKSVFLAPDLAATAFNVCEFPTPSFEELGIEAPEELETIVMRLHKKRPEDRYQSEGELVSGLETVLASIQGT